MSLITVAYVRLVLSFTAEITSGHHFWGPLNSFHPYIPLLPFLPSAPLLLPLPFPAANVARGSGSALVSPAKALWMHFVFAENASGGCKCHSFLFNILLLCLINTSITCVSPYFPGNACRVTGKTYNPSQGP